MENATQIVGNVEIPTFPEKFKSYKNVTNEVLEAYGKLINSEKIDPNLIIKKQVELLQFMIQSMGLLSLIEVDNDYFETVMNTEKEKFLNNL